jgi:hypothetical protein
VRGDRYTLRKGELADLSRERRSNSHKIRICFKKTRMRFRNGYFRRRLIEQLAAEGMTRGVDA